MTLRLAALTALAIALQAATPAPREADFTLGQFTFSTGESLSHLNLHYTTLGTPNGDNAVLIMHGTGGTGQAFLAPQFAGHLFGPGQLLDAEKYFIILPDNIGHGKSTKPSDGLNDKFPHYGYQDLVTAQYRLVTEGLGLKHLRLVMGTSMGGMLTWLWGERYPTFMDALMPLASLPTEISGRNRFFRRMVIDPLRTDPENGLRTAVYTLMVMTGSPLQLQKQAPTRDQADRLFDETFAKRLAANNRWDMLYQFDSSRDYNPLADLEKIQAPLLAVNSADDQVNPPELGILEREIKRVPHGRAIVLPITGETRGHGTHSLPAVWKQHLAQLLNEPKPAPPTVSAAAEKLLKLPVYSVLDKAQPAPSGDKHDFVSYAPYWWPDPAKPNGLPYIRKDGHTNHALTAQGDAGHFSATANAIDQLTAEFVRTGDPRFAENAATRVRVWFLNPESRMTPHLNFGQAVMGRTEGRAAGLVTMRGLIPIVAALPQLPCTENEKRTLQTWFADYLKWLETSPIGREEGAAKNNHGSWYAAQALAIELYLNRPGAARRRAQSLNARIDSQIEPTGRQPLETARQDGFSYSVFNLEALATAAQLARPLGVDLWANRLLPAALAYLEPFAAGNKPWPYTQLKPIKADALDKVRALRKN